MTADRAAAAARAAGLDGVRTYVRRVSFPELDAHALVAWRLGMAPLAPFLDRLQASERAAVVDDAVGRLDPDGAPMVRSFVVITAEGG